jgi:hypothetical protein
MKFVARSAGRGFSSGRGARSAGIPSVFKRRATKPWGKSARALRVAAKIGPYFVVILDSGLATAFGFRLVSANFGLQRSPSQTS